MKKEVFVLCFDDILKSVINILLGIFIYSIFRSTLLFHFQRRRAMESLKALTARSVATRVTSEESLTMLELPRSLIRDLVVAHEEKKRDVDRALQWVTQINTLEMNALTLTDFGKFFFPELPLEKIKEVLQKNFPVSFYERNLCPQAPCFYHTLRGCKEKVSLVFLKDIMALMPQMKNILCALTNHIVIVCPFCHLC